MTAFYWCQLKNIENTQPSRLPFLIPHVYRGFPNFYYLVKGCQMAANYRNNLPIENLKTLYLKENKAMVRKANSNFKWIKNLTRKFMYCHIWSAVLAITSLKMVFQNLKGLKERNSICNHRNYHKSNRTKQSSHEPSIPCNDAPRHVAQACSE